MTPFEWIVCERHSRWAPALRVALARFAASPGDAAELALARQISLREVRSLGELSDRVAQQPGAFAFVEVTSANLGATLSWLAAAVRETSGCRFIAALDRNLPVRPTSDALYEAGVTDVTTSPRRLESAIRLGILHLSGIGRAATSRWTRDRPIDEWADSLLPWQAAR